MRLQGNGQVQGVARASGVKGPTSTDVASSRSDVVRQGDAYADNVPPSVAAPEISHARLPSMSLGVPSARDLLGVELSELYQQIHLKEAPTPAMAAAIDRVLGRYAQVIDTLETTTRPGEKESPQDYLRSHLIDLIRVLAKTEEWFPAVTIYGTARSKPPGTADAAPAHLELFERSMVYGAVLNLLDLDVRTGAGPGAMKAGPAGYLRVRELMEAFKRTGTKPTADQLAQLPEQLRNFMQRVFDGSVVLNPIDREGISALAPKADTESRKVQGVKIELNANELTFEQNVEPEIEDPIRSENFLGRKIGLWFNTLMTIVDDGGWGTKEELLESLVLAVEGFLRLDTIAVREDSVWVPFLDALKEHSAIKDTALDRVARFQDPEDLATLYAEQSKKVGVELSPSRVFEEVAMDLIDGFVALKDLPAATKVFGAAEYDEKDPALSEIREFTRLLTEAGVPIRSSGSHDAVKAMVEGVQDGGGDTEKMQILPYWDDQPQQLSSKLTTDHAFRTFLVQKELLMRGDDPVVFFKPDEKNLSYLYSLLTLVQTGEHNPKPILLVGEGWDKIINSTTPAMLEKKLISANDPDRVKIVSVEDAAGIVRQHYERQRLLAMARDLKPTGQTKDLTPYVRNAQRVPVPERAAAMGEVSSGP
jgi:hypothetical protein